MKKTIVAAAIATVIAGPALANGPLFCERDITVPGVDTASLPFYAHGCDRFQRQPLTAHQVAQLGEHCSVESTADGPVEEEVTVEVVVERGVADGSTHHRDNLTSMGAAASNGEQVMRVRSATDGNPVTIVRHGHGVVFSGVVNAGDTFIEVGSPGTYIATTGSRRITKATGPQTWNDVSEITRTVVTEYEGIWNQPGPRTDRCGYFGDIIR